MPWVVVGVEGRPSEDAAAFWGAAVVQDGEWLVNPVTGRRAPFEDARQLEREGHITRLETPLEARAGAEREQLMLLMTRREHRFADVLNIDGQRLAGQVGSRTSGEWHCRLFAGLGALDHYADLVIGTVIRRVLGPSPPAPELANAMLELGSALDSSHPDLNAVRAHRAKDDVNARCFAARVRGEAARERFQAFLDALRDEDPEHVLKYDGNLTRDGGMDVAQVVPMLQEMQRVDRAAAEELKAQHACFAMGPLPSVRLWELHAASARFVFRAVAAESELERVARNLGLRRLRRYFAGDLPEEPEARRKVAEAVRKLVTLDSGTVVKHGVDAEHLEPIEETWAVEDGEATEPVSHVMRLFGFVGGVSKRARKSELYVQTKARQAIVVSTADDGDGHPPMGVARDDFLWRPAVISLLRGLDDNACTYHARRVTLLEDGDQVTVDTIPSRVAAHAYITGLSISLRRDGLRLHGPGFELDLDAAATQEAAEDWYQRYADACAALELQLAAERSHLQLVMPPQPPVAQEPERLLDAVDAAGGATTPVHEDTVIEAARRRPGAHRRQANNILRPSETTRASAHWFVRDRAHRTIQLTAIGRARLRLFLAFGGRLPGRPST